MREKCDRYKGAVVPKSKRQAIYARDGHRCVYCNVEVGAVASHTVGRATLDHLIPNRDDSQKNLVTACFSCNQAKKNIGYREFLAWKYNPVEAQAVVDRIHDLISRGINVRAARQKLSDRRGVA